MGGIPDILWQLLNIGRAEIGSAQANEANLGLHNEGRQILGMPLDKPLPGMSHAEWRAYQQNPQAAGLGSELHGILGQQTGYGNQALSDMMRSGVQGYSDLYGRTQDRNAGLQSSYGRLGAQIGDRGSALERELSQGYGRLGQGFAGREQDVMGLLRGMGATERMDINEAMANTAAGNQSALRSRGLGSSTIAGGQATADSRARTRELGALEERLRTQQAGTLAGLRGDTLGAQERGLGASAALGSSNLDRNTQFGMSGLGSQERGNTTLGGVQEAGLRNYLGSQSDIANFNLGQYGQQMGITNQNADRQLGWLQQLQHQGPSTDAAWSGFMNYLAAKNTPQPEQPNFFESMAPGIGGGAGMALGGMALAPFTGGLSLGASAASPFATSAAQQMGAAQLGNFGWGWGSDRNIKRDIRVVDNGAVLDAIESLPVYRWQYDVPDQPGGEHIGPMSQDFFDTFGLGDNETRINMVDAFGVALSAIKALRQEVNELKARIAE